MTPLAPLLTGYLRDYMPRQRGYSPLSCETYAYGFQLLLAFAAKRTGKRPSQLHVEQLDAKLILDFLTHIEGERGNGAATRNLRLAAIKSFMLRRIPRAVGIGTDRANPRYSHQASRSEAYTASDDGRNPGNLECARYYDAFRSPRSGDTASLLCRRLASLGTRRRTAGKSIAAAAGEHSHSRQGSPRTVASTLEGDHGRSARMACSSRACSCIGAVRQCRRRADDARRIRICARQAYACRGRNLPFPGRTLGVATSVAAQYCRDHVAGDA
jgi:hypothetical protein